MLTTLKNRIESGDISIPNMKNLRCKSNNRNLVCRQTVGKIRQKIIFGPKNNSFVEAYYMIEFPQQSQIGVPYKVERPRSCDFKSDPVVCQSGHIIFDVEENPRIINKLLSGISQVYPQ